MLRMNATNSSTECFEDLSQNHLLNHYHSWEPKTDGTMDGLTLFGKRKNGTNKTVYVKKYQPYLGIEFHELDDLMAFDILRACGIIAPKAKIKSSKEHHYLFSTAINQIQPVRHDKQLEYIAMDKLIVRDTPYHRKALTDKLVSTANDRTAVVQFDTTNLAKFIQLGLILRLCDLRASNVGILIARQHNHASANIAIIDFAIRYQHITMPKHTPHTTVTGLISTQPALKNFLRQPILPELDDSHYLTAFHELEKDFLPACEQAWQHAKSCASESPKNIARANKLLQYWKNNFHIVQEFTQSIELDNSHADDVRANMRP